MGPVKGAAVGFVGKAKRNAGNRRPGGPVAELYVSENANESGQGCDCDWDDCGSGDSSDYELDAVEVADGHKHDCNPVHLEMIGISVHELKRKVEVNGQIGESGRELEGWRRGMMSLICEDYHLPLCLPPANTQTGPWVEESTDRSSLPYTTHDHEARRLVPVHEEAWFSSG